MTLPSIALFAALQTARAAWGTQLDPDVQLAPLNDCKFHHGRPPTVAIADWNNDVITVNSNCRWHGKQAILNAVLTHELGHIIARDPEHSDNPASVMFWSITTRQAITPADRKQRNILQPAQ